VGQPTRLSYAWPSLASTKSPMHRIEEFPSWSWVGWIDSLQECLHHIPKPDAKDSPPLRIWAYKNNIRILFLDLFTERTIEQYVGRNPVVVHGDTMTKIDLALQSSEWKVPQFNLNGYTDVEREKFPLVQGLICNITVTDSKTHWMADGWDTAKVNRVHCEMYGYNLALGHHRLLCMQREVKHRHSIFNFLVVK
jgi:hypothetical protein